MLAETLAFEIEELKAAYGAIQQATTDEQTLVRIERVPLPSGCQPPESTGILVLGQGQRPQFYLKPGIRLANGVIPRSTSSVQIAGEEWLQFSFTFVWDESTSTLLQFVEASLRRFAKGE